MATSSLTDRTQQCSDCGFEFPLDRTNCPRCARPQIFPNVSFACTTQEHDKLNNAFNQSLRDADSRGCRPQVEQFTDACRNATAVFRCSTERLHRQIASGSELFAPYHHLEQLRLRKDPSSGFDFEKLRPQAEIELLGNEKYVGQIHYASLSLDGQGINTYGDCVVQLSEPLIAHRASCFEGNTAVIYAIEPGFDTRLRSDWKNRHKICTAVMASDVNCSTDATDHVGILVRPGSTPEDDVYIEVHVFGDMVAGTFQSVHFAQPNPSRRDKVYRDVVIDKLNNAGVAFTSA